MANPRIDELKRRIEREPGSRLFAQLAEELRKDGDLGGAIRVARTGLAAHPNYPSARLTLGRALFDTGQFGPARVELQAVLRGAPDNILAARMLAECLEGLGDTGAALLQYRAALRLSPGDKQIEAQVRAVEQRLAAGGTARAAASAAAAGGLPLMAGPSAAPVAPPVVSAPKVAPVQGTAPGSHPPPPPSPAARPAGAASDDFDDVFEPAPSWKRPAPPPAQVDDEAILLLEDEAPTLPGTPFARPPQVERHSPVEGLAAPVTLAFAAPPLIPEPAATAHEPAGVHPDLASDTLAGSPAFAPSPREVPAAHAPTPAPAPHYPAPPDQPVPSDRAPLGSSVVAGPPPDDTSSTAAFEALPKPGSATSEPAPAEAAAWEWERVPLSSPAPAAAPPAAPPEPVAPEPGAGWGPVEAPRPLEPSPPAEAAAEARGETPEAPGGAPLSTPTLAELYFDQGFFAKAVEVYEQILEREPQNERWRARLIEVKALARTLDVPPREDPRVAQRHALQRKIARLEQMLAAVRRG